MHPLVASSPGLLLLYSNHNYRKKRFKEVMDSFFSTMFIQGIAGAADGWVDERKAHM